MRTSPRNVLKSSKPCRSAKRRSSSLILRTRITVDFVGALLCAIVLVAMTPPDMVPSGARVLPSKYYFDRVAGAGRQTLMHIIICASRSAVHRRSTAKAMLSSRLYWGRASLGLAASSGAALGGNGALLPRMMNLTGLG